MYPSGQVRRMFPGSNTPGGYFPYYQHILPQDLATRIFVLKGGPGVGKSTFIKRIARALCERGYDIEYHHCSADPDSLDALVVPEIGIAMLDGTSPHVVDPKTPGAVDEILNFGVFWDEAGIRENRSSIHRVMTVMSEHFQRAFRYLKAARAVYDDIEASYCRAVRFGALNQITSTLLDELVDTHWSSEQPGRLRKLFASAITPDGIINHLDTLIGPHHRTVVIKGEPGTGKSTMVEKVAMRMIELGYDVEAFHCPFDPARMEHLVVEELGLAVTTSTDPHIWKGPASLVIDTSDALDEGALGRFAPYVEQGREAYQTLLGRAINSLADAKSIHDELEKYYVPHIRFDEIEPLYEQVLERILNYAAERVRS